MWLVVCVNVVLLAINQRLVFWIVFRLENNVLICFHIVVCYKTHLPECVDKQTYDCRVRLIRYWVDR